jgi:hypothetical protein
MRPRVLILIVLVLLVLLLPTNIKWWRRDRPQKDTEAVVEAPPPPPPFLLGAGGRPITYTLDSLPPEVMTAVKARYPEFVPHNPKEMPDAIRASYPPSADEGMVVLRGNLASGTAYAVVGTQGQSQMVVGVVRDPNGVNGWSARSMSSTGSPPFYPWVIVSKRRRGHPNGRLDAIVVRIIDPKGDYTDLYAWNPTEKRFNLGGGPR